MTDKELLVLAAKAAGIEILYWDGATTYIRVLNTDKTNSEFMRKWVPLTHDGDALRLAVKLKLDIRFIGDSVCAELHSRDHAPSGWARYSDSDANTATRRAIVLAAAEIGKTL